LISTSSVKREFGPGVLSWPEIVADSYQKISWVGRQKRHLKIKDQIVV